MCCYKNIKINLVYRSGGVLEQVHEVVQEKGQRETQKRNLWRRLSNEKKVSPGMI